MYLKKFENLEVILNHYSQPSRWLKTMGFKPELNKIYLVHWSKLITKSFYRKKFIKVKCNDCKKIFERRIRNLNPEINIHYCKKCQCKGERNGNFGKPMNESFKKSYEKMLLEKGNPFTWESSKEKIKDKNVWLKISKKNRGRKNTDETKNKMSLSAIKAFKEGRRIPVKSWGKIKIKQYNGMDYQSKYEFKFLKYLESINKFNLIERGPKITYKDENGNEHNYFIDYKIKNTNIVFEIKSTYYWEKYLNINLIKEKESLKLYNYHIIMDNNFKNIDKLFN